MIARSSLQNTAQHMRAITGRSLTLALISLSAIGFATSVSAQDVPIYFDTEPALLTQIQGMANETANVPSRTSSPWLTATARNVTYDRFELALDRSESAIGAVTRSERVGILAVASGSSGSFTDNVGAAIRFAAQRTGNTVRGWSNGCRETAYFSPRYAQPPLVFASKITRNDSDGGWLRRCSLSGSAVGLVVDEDISQDSERAKNGESAAVVSFSGPFAAAFNTGDGDRWQLQGRRVTLINTLSEARFTGVRFASEFQEVPIVFVLPTSQGADPSALRLRNVTRSGFSVSQVEPTGNDGPHVSMDIHYLAITPGSHRLPDGTRIFAKRMSIANTQAAPGVGNGNNGWSQSRFSMESPNSNLPPDARIITNVRNGTAPLVVQFDARASSDDQGIAEYIWQCGDGRRITRTTGAPVSHQYVNAGTYNVRLTVTDGGGLTDGATTTITVREPDVPDQPPQARFTQSTDSGNAPLSVTFDASTSTDDSGISSLRWDFGDGNQGEG